MRMGVRSTFAVLHPTGETPDATTDEGSLVATGARSISWEYCYTLNVVIKDFSGDKIC